MSLLAIDVGNTTITFGLFDGETLRVNWRLMTVPDRTPDELWVRVSRLFDERQVAPGEIDGVVVSSVVPALTPTVSRMVADRLGARLVVVDAENAGLPIGYEDPAEVGADRLVNGVAARERFGDPPRPMVVVDFGTATTFDVISARGEYRGGVICPGLEMSADALFNRAARLPRVDVRHPSSVIGRTTVASMQSGLFYGHMAMVEGIVRRLAAELRANGEVWCIATGGLADAIASETDVIDEVCPDLTLVGLRLVWERNR